MLKTGVWGAALGLLTLGAVLAEAVLAGPVGGPGPRGLEIPGASADKPGGTAFEQAFQGGQRATVLAFSTDRKVTTNMGLIVFDAKGNVVTEAVGNRMVAAAWYPPREAKYRIVVTNSAPTGVRAYVVVK